MDEQFEPITLNTFNKMLEKDIAISRDLANYLEIKYNVFDTCLTLTILCQDLERKNLEGAAFTKQRIVDYYAECEEKINKTFPFHKPLPLCFDDLDHLKIQLTNLKAATDGMLDLARDTVASIQRYPELLFTLHTMHEKGIPTDDIDAAIQNTEAELNEALASQTFPTESFKTFILNLNFYRIQVQKLERWIHQKASETALVIAPPPPAPAPMPTPTANMDPNVLSAFFAKVDAIKDVVIEAKNAAVNAKIAAENAEKKTGLTHFEVTNMRQDNKNFQKLTTETLENIVAIGARIAAETLPLDQQEEARSAAKLKAKPLLTQEQAIGLMQQVCGFSVTRQTLNKWLKNGIEPETGKPISDAALASIESWYEWCEDYRKKKAAKQHLGGEIDRHIDKEKETK